MGSRTSSYFTYGFSIATVVVALIFFFSIDELTPIVISLVELLMTGGTLQVVGIALFVFLSGAVYLGYRWYNPL